MAAPSFRTDTAGDMVTYTEGLLSAIWRKRDGEAVRITVERDKDLAARYSDTSVVPASDDRVAAVARRLVAALRAAEQALRDEFAND